MTTHSKQELQTHVFTDGDKCRLIDCVKVEETKNRRKKFSWLALSIDASSKVHITWIKGKDYTKKHKWKLQEVKTVDLCHKDGKDTPEFEMHLDSLYKWSAVSIAERDSFVRSLYRYARKLLPANDPIRFKNYRSDLFEDLQMSAELAAKLQATDGFVYCYVSLWMEICIKMSRCAYRCKYTHSCMNIPPTDIKYNSAKLQYSFEVIGIFGDILNKWCEILLFAVVIRLIEGRFSSRPLLIQPLLIFDIFEPSGRDLDVATEYQALSAKEESDLETLMIKYEFAISNAEAFTEQLNRELSNLDAANVHAIMESERKVQSLMDMFDTVIGEVTHLEDRLDAYDALLREVRDSVLRMEEKDAVIHVQNDNIERLRQLLEGIVTRRDLIHEHEMTLLGPKDLDTEEGLARCFEAAMALEEAMSVPMHPALSEMTAVKDRNNSLENLKKCVTRCLSHYINDQLIKISVDYGSGRRTIAAGEPVLRKHEFVHNSLKPFSPLMAWLKRNDDVTYQFIKNNYLDRFGQIYQQEIIIFFEQANAKLRFEESRSASGILDTKKGTLVLNAQEGVVSTPTKQRTTCLLGKFHTNLRYCKIEQNYFELNSI